MRTTRCINVLYFLNIFSKTTMTRISFEFPRCFVSLKNRQYSLSLSSPYRSSNVFSTVKKKLNEASNFIQTRFTVKKSTQPLRFRASSFAHVRTSPSKLLLINHHIRTNLCSRRKKNPTAFVTCAPVSAIIEYRVFLKM